MRFLLRRNDKVGGLEWIFFSYFDYLVFWFLCYSDAGGIERKRTGEAIALINLNGFVLLKKLFH